MKLTRIARSTRADQRHRVVETDGVGALILPATSDLRLAYANDRTAYTGRMRSVTREDRVALIALLRDRPKGVTVPMIADALLDYRDVSGAVRSFQPVDQELVFEDAAPDTSIDQAAADLDDWEASGLRVLTILDADYPGSLRDIHESPPLLIAQGELVADDLGVSVVGSRDATDRGLSIATSVATALAQRGFTTISGLAAGIDTAAHTAALAAGGRTVAVIGTGHRRNFPKENADLQARIAREGLVVSQFWPDASPRSSHFPIRNATMSGLGIATFVAEAGEHSGARIQARKAVEHGRPVILSDLVVGRCEWAQKLLDRPNVWEASNIDDAMVIIEKVRDDRSRIGSVLEALSDSLTRST